MFDQIDIILSIVLAVIIAAVVILNIINTVRAKRLVSQLEQLEDEVLKKQTEIDRLRKESRAAAEITGRASFNQSAETADASEPRAESSGTLVGPGIEIVTSSVNNVSPEILSIKPENVTLAAENTALPPEIENKASSVPEPVILMPADPGQEIITSVTKDLPLSPLQPGDALSDKTGGNAEPAVLEPMQQVPDKSAKPLSVTVKLFDDKKKDANFSRFQNEIVMAINNNAAGLIIDFSNILFIYEKEAKMLQNLLGQLHQAGIYVTFLGIDTELKTLLINAGIKSPSE